MKNLTTSLVLTTYNWIDALRITLDSIARQTHLPDEVIIADDGSRSDTSDFIRDYAAGFPTRLVHVWGKDDGYRRSVMINKAFGIARGEYILQTDGDIVLHRNFVADHIRHAARGVYARGSRSFLDEKLTARIFAGEVNPMRLPPFSGSNPLNAVRVPLLSPIVSHLSRDIDNVKGCNMAFFKSDLLNVNGYDNTLTGWGHEDKDLSFRLSNAGVRMKKVKFEALAFHLHHRFLSRDNADANRARAFESLHAGTVRTPSGITEVDSIANPPRLVFEHNPL